MINSDQDMVLKELCDNFSFFKMNNFGKLMLKYQLTAYKSLKVALVADEDIPGFTFEVSDQTDSYHFELKHDYTGGTFTSTDYNFLRWDMGDEYFYAFCTELFDANIEIINEPIFILEKRRKWQLKNIIHG